MADKTLVSLYDGTLVKVGAQMVRFDKGVAIDPQADEEHVAVLLDRGMVAEGEPAGGIDHDPDAPAPFVAPEETAARRGRAKAAEED